MAHDTKTVNGILRTDRRGNSTNGNASFDVTFVTEGGNIIRGRTRPNSQFTSTMPREGRACASWHETDGGSVVFTDITAWHETPAQKRLTCSEDWTQDDFLTARRIAREQGYEDSCAFLTSSDLPGMYLLPLRASQQPRVIVKTPEFGMIIMETVET